MTLLLEHWKPVVGYEGHYSVTNMGRVFSHKSKCTIKPTVCNGYLRAPLRKNNKCRHYYVHRLVAAAFLDGVGSGLTVNHMNGVKVSNMVSNLEYLSNIENIRHAVRLGISNRGSRHGLAKLTESDVVNLRLYDSKLSLNELAKKYNCNESTVSRALCGKSWKHV